MFLLERRYSFLVIGGVLVTTILFLCWWIHRQSTEVAVRAPQSPITQVFASGRVEGKSEDIALCPQILGQIEQVFVQEGSYVKQGDMLLQLDDKQYNAQIALYKAQIKASEATMIAKEAQLKRAKLDLDRALKLQPNRAIADTDVDALQGVYDSLIAEVKAASAQIDIALAQQTNAYTQLGYTRIKSPIDGVILKVNARIGECVGPSISLPVESLFILADLSELRVRAYVEEMSAHLVKVGQEAKVAVYGTSIEVSAKVIRAAPFLGRKSMFTDKPAERVDIKTREIWLSLEGQSDLLPGQRVDVTITL